VVFFESGRRHAGDPVGRAASIGLSPGLTRILGWAEMAAALGGGFGVLTQVAALGLMLVMLGAIQKKLFVWHTGFWGEKTYGWHYDLTYLVANLVILTTGGGRLVIL
jgi:putative oxidoreductase